MTVSDITPTEVHTMRVFVTGASGWIGSAVVADLVERDHEVTGLARSDASADQVAAAGAEVLRGEVTDLDVLRDGAAASDAVVHLAFRHELAFGGDPEAAVASDRAAIETIGETLADTGRPLAVASGVAGLGAGADETTRVEPGPGLRGRSGNERLALSLADRGVRAMSVRFAPTVHGEGDTGFVKRIVDADRAHGAAAYVGDGSNRWAAVHRDDAARLVVLGIESAPAGSVLHAVAESVTMRDLAEAIGAGLELPVASLEAERAGEVFGPFAPFVAMDMDVSSARTRELLHWTPSGPTLLQDIAAGHYFVDRPAKY
jgi:nucleoside-diphosphate-sugar epimerase